MFRRRSSTDSVGETPEESQARLAAEAETRADKGRPTPSRREAEAARKERLKPTRRPKELARRERQRRATARAKMRQAMVTGDEKNLPARDRGPVRAFVRDLVDARLNVAEYLLPLLVVILALSFVPTLINLQFTLWLVTIVGTTAGHDLAGVPHPARAARRASPAEQTRGALAYALLRSSQLRRLRLPKPRVKRGTPLPPPPA